MEYAVVVELGHSRGNVGSSCAYIRNLGNNGYRSAREGRRRLTNEWVHHPTATVSSNPTANDRRGTYSFHPEASALIHHLKELFVLLASEPVQTRNLEITPEMAHVIFLAFHGLGVNLLEIVLARVSLQDLLRQLDLLLLFRLGFLLWGIFEEHLPQSLGLEVVLALIGGGISEDIRNSLFELLDGDCEAICFVVFNHLEERVTDSGVSRQEERDGTPESY